MPDDNSSYILTISKSELAALPAAKFNGRIVVVETPDDVVNAVEELRKSDMVGFDTETRPSFKKGHLNGVSLIQLSTRDVCFLFRIIKTGITPPLKMLLEDPQVTKIGVSVHDDFHNLQRICDFKPAGFIDLQSYVKNFDIEDTSLSKIYAIVLGERVSKGQRLSNWESDTLTVAQQAYASLDAKACIDIFDRLSSGSFHAETSPYRHTRMELEAIASAQECDKQQDRL